jgi:hypothetical protein
VSKEAMIRFRADQETADRIDAQAARRGVSRSEWMRLALGRVLDEAERRPVAGAPVGWLEDLPNFDEPDGDQP